AVRPDLERPRPAELAGVDDLLCLEGQDRRLLCAHARRAQQEHQPDSFSSGTSRLDTDHREAARSRSGMWPSATLAAAATDRVHFNVRPLRSLPLRTTSYLCSSGTVSESTREPNSVCRTAASGATPGGSSTLATRFPWRS